jgi:hypothetical protein
MTHFQRRKENREVQKNNRATGKIDGKKEK